MVQRLLSGAEFKMDPLVSLYYFAPVCAFMNLTVALFWEIPNVTMEQVYAVGLWTLLLNASIAFMLNVSVVFLVSSYLPYSASQTLTPIHRSAKPPALSSHSAVSSRISSSSSPPSSSGEP